VIYSADSHPRRQSDAQSSMAQPNPPPTWATQDPDEQPMRASNSQNKPSSGDVNEEHDVAAASSVVGSSPVKSTHAPEKMDVEEEEDAETARNRAAEALSDLANAAVFAAPLPTNTSVVNDTSGRMQAPHLTTSADILAKQKRRPAALLTPTRRAGPAKSQHLSPNLSVAGSSSSRRSPLVGNLEHSTVMSVPGLPDGSTSEPHVAPLIANINGIQTPLFSASPRVPEKASKIPYNSPFTNQPFVSTGALPLSRSSESVTDALIFPFTLVGCRRARCIECSDHQYGNEKRRADVSCAKERGWGDVHTCGSAGMAFGFPYEKGCS
jgi:hypothetical protein